jgi:putative oxidoreductase
MVKEFLKTDKSAAQFLIRVALGVVIFPHGAQKVLGLFGGPGFMKTIQAFSEMGFPPWSVVALMAIESLGAILLILGFLTRLWALGLMIFMSICMFMVHVQYGFFMNWLGQQKGEGFEFHILALGICLALIVRGGGTLSLDRRLAPEGHRLGYSR